MSKPNILFIILDATRADACSCYGNPFATTPALDQLATEGTLFEQAISPAPWTLPALASLFTGLYPSQTGIYTQRKLASSFSSLPTLLKQAGYRTFGISNNGWMSVDFGLQQGFDVMHKLWQWIQTEEDITTLSLTENDPNQVLARALPKRLLKGNVVKNVLNTFFYRYGRRSRDYGASRTFTPLTRWIREQEAPWFAFVHYLDSHLEYKPPMKWARRFVHDTVQAEKFLKADQWSMAWRHIAGLDPMSSSELETWRELYLAEVAYTDYYMGQLIDWLDETGRLDNTFLIVTADHGENLGEHHLLNHQYCVYDTLLHVPLVIRYPGLFAKGQRVSEPVQTMDLFATLLEVAGLTSQSVPSRTLLTDDFCPFIVSEYGAPRPPHAGALARFGLKRADLIRFERGFTSIRTDKWKLIVGTDNAVELYQLDLDPREEHNLADQFPQQVDLLRLQLEQWWHTHNTALIGDVSEQVTVESKVEQRLQDLGYLQ